MFIMLKFGTRVKKYSFIKISSMFKTDLSINSEFFLSAVNIFFNQITYKKLFENCLSFDFKNLFASSLHKSTRNLIFLVLFFSEFRLITNSG